MEVVYDKVLELGGEIPFPYGCDDLSLYIKVDSGRQTSYDLSKIDQLRFDWYAWSYFSAEMLDYHQSMIGNYAQKCVSLSGVNFELLDLMWVSESSTELDLILNDLNDLTYSLNIEELVTNFN